MYTVTRNYITERDDLYAYCAETTAAAKNLYNASMYRIRNHFTAKSIHSNYPPDIFRTLPILYR